VIPGAEAVVHRAGREVPLRDRLAELWAYRHLAANLVVRDLKVRYKGSVLGFLWSMASPLLMMLVFYFLFRVLWRQSVPNFHVFVLVAVLAWNWFNLSVSAGVGCIVANAALINKVYFPREILPLSIVLGELVNFLLALPVLVAMILLSGIPLTVHALWLPVIVAIQAVFTLGVVLLVATANVYYRDVGMILEVVLLAWFFLSPVFYDYAQFRGTLLHLGPLAVDAERLAYILNPVGTLIGNYRTILYGSVGYADGVPLSAANPPGAPDLGFLARTLATALLVFAAGYGVFARRSGRFGEEV